ncbi:MAG TPA: hypothetical protein VFN36_03730 [Solirubrobacteraceae bacterium]|nr:hypothetical protein [Solirubrobacteraceae bacterium]
MAGDTPDPGQLSEEQLRAAYEQEIKRVRVEHVVLENIVTMVNLGMRRTGLMPGTEDERDLGQVQLAIDSVRALMPQIEQIAPEQLTPIRDALAQLQLAFVQAQGGAPARGPQAGAAPEAGAGARPPAPGEAPASEEAGPAQRSGRLWVPGQ